MAAVWAQGPKKPKATVFFARWGWHVRPGLQNYMQWLSSWKVFRVAAVSLDIALLASLLAYEKQIERLAVQPGGSKP